MPPREIDSRLFSKGWGFLLFSPDATTTRLHPDGLHYLQAKGFEIEEAWWAHPDPVHTAELYAENRTGEETAYQDGLVDRLFSLAPSLACIVRNRAPRDRPAADRLAELKGPSDPRRCDSDHLRWILGAENKVMNRIHTSDSSHAAVREARLFASCEVADFNPDCPRHGAPVLGRSSSFSALLVLCELRSRLWESQALDAGTAEEVRRWLNVERDAAAARRKESSDFRAIETAWVAQRDLGRGIGLPYAARAALNATTSVTWKDQELEPLLDVVREAGVPPSASEELILRCQFAYGPVPALANTAF